MDNEEYRNYLKGEAWRKKASERLQIDGGRCAGCGCAGTMKNPIECHHVTYKNIGNEDVYVDLVSLCHSCHKLVHKIMERQTSADGRHGWRDSPQIPQIHLFNISGFIEFKEVTR